MSDQASGGNGRPHGSNRGRGHRVAEAVVAVPVTILMPFVVLYRSLRDIWNDPASRGILIAAVLLLAAGTFIFMRIEDLSLLDSFYFCFITLATIGYGDISPVTELGKLVTVAYSIAGLGIMAALISTIAGQRRRAHHPASADEPAV